MNHSPTEVPTPSVRPLPAPNSRVSPDGAEVG